MVTTNYTSQVRVILLLSFCGLHYFAIGQSSRIDSLQRLIDREDDSKRKVELLNQLSFSYFDFKVEQANATTQQALQLARMINDKKGESWALAYRGLYFFLSGILPEAKEQFNQSLSAAITLKDNNLVTYSLAQMGNVYRDKGSFDSAYQFYQQAMRSRMKADENYRSNVNKNLARYYLIIHKPDSALQCMKVVLKSEEQQNDQILLADALILMGTCYRALEDADEAEKYYQKAYAISNGDKIIEADYFQNMGEIYFMHGEFQRAVQNWNKILSMYRNNQYKYALAELLSRMGDVFQQQGYLDLSSEYLNNGLKIAEKAGYLHLTGRIYQELAWMSYRGSNFEYALKNNLLSVKILRYVKADLDVAESWDLRGLIERNLKNYDTAQFYHEKSLEVRIHLNNKAEISDGYFNLGEFYLKTARPKIALPYYFKSLALDKALGTNYGISLGYNRIGRIYTQLAVFDSAKLYLNKSLDIAIPISSNDVFRDNYLDFATYYEKVGEAEKAIPYYKKYNQLTDSLFNMQTAQSLSSYRTLYDVERSEKEIELLQKDNALSSAQIQKQRTILYSVIAGFIGLLVLSIFYYRFSIRLKKLNISLAEKNVEIHTQSEKLKKVNKSLSTSNSEIASQKEEIQAQAEELTESNQTISSINESLEERIEARTLELKQAYKELDTFFYRSSHDFRRPLTTFMGLAEVAKITVKDKAALELFQRVNETAHYLDKMLMKLQSISDLGVQELIYREVFIEEFFKNELLANDQQIRQKNIRTKTKVDHSLSFHSYPALVKILIANIIENAVSFCGVNDPYIFMNAYKKNGEIIIEVEDNGQGIEKEYIERVFEMYFRGNEHSKGNGLGLYIVKKTADKLNARVELISDAGVGTKISIIFPYTNYESVYKT